MSTAPSLSLTEIVRPPATNIQITIGEIQTPEDKIQIKVQANNGALTFENVYTATNFINEFKALLEMEDFKIKNLNLNGYVNITPEITAELKDKLPVEKIYYHMRSNSFDTYHLKLLELCKPEVLEKIQFGQLLFTRTENEHFRKLINMDQWKKAKELQVVELPRNRNTTIDPYLHFQKILILNYMEDMNVPDIWRIVEHYVLNDYPIGSYFDIYQVNWNVESIIPYFGPKFESRQVRGARHIKWFSLSSSDKFLEIRFFDNEIRGQVIDRLLPVLADNQQVMQ